MNLGPHVIAVLRAEQVPGDYGNTTEADWANPTETQWAGCSVQPATGDEFTTDRDTFITRYQVWAPPAIDVTATDRIRWQGRTYDIDGDPLRWDFPPLSHVVLNLRGSQNA